MTLPIQDEPESTVGRKPSRWPHDEGGPARQDGGVTREAGNVREGGPEGRDLPRREPPAAPGATTVDGN